MGVQLKFLRYVVTLSRPDISQSIFFIQLTITAKAVLLSLPYLKTFVSAILPAWSTPSPTPAHVLSPIFCSTVATLTSSLCHKLLLPQGLCTCCFLWNRELSSISCPQASAQRGPPCPAPHFCHLRLFYFLPRT